MELQNNVNKNVNNEDENVKKKRKRYTLCGKILIIIGFILILIGFLGFMFSIVFMDDWFDEIEDFSPAIFMVPFVIGMFCLFGGTVLNNLGRTGSIKHRNLQAHTIIINESTPVESIEEPKEEKKGGKCPNCGAPYKAKDKNCRYCGTDL